MKRLFCWLLSIFILTPGVAVGEVVFLPGGDTPLAGSCVVDVLGTDSGTAKFIAVWLPSIYNCKMGYYLGPSATDCTKCIENHYCPGGDFGYDEFLAQGLEECPEDLVSPEGMYEIAQCGRRFHAGEHVVYMRRTKVTTPSLNFDLDRDGEPDYFISLSNEKVPMSSSTERSLRLNIGGVIYSAYDDTVKTDEVIIADVETTEE